ncbi:MAG: type II toxin-antitoxin system VapC family toxin [Candidatus Eremiobacterota bacterium]
MKLLLDTCTLLWMAGAPDQLGQTVRQAIDRPETELWVSDCSVWEICLKWEAGKLTLPLPPRSWVEQQRRAWTWNALPIARSHIFRVSELPLHHRDPFDRLLVAQAIEEEMVLATPDPRIARYPVAVCWS